MSTHIRLAQNSDLPAIVDIYNDAVLNTTASWDYEPTTLDQRMQWFRQHQDQGFPVLVAHDEMDCVIGWGALSKFREKIGYQFTVEHSVYVAAGSRGQGVGRAIVQALIGEARSLGKHVLIGGVEKSNEASLRLHRGLGFEEVAHFKQVGYKFGRWLDLVFLQKVLVNG
ncbi:MAG: N-acetyltransferase family protein [Anaerolineae bacterium]